MRRLISDEDDGPLRGSTSRRPSKRSGGDAEARHTITGDSADDFAAELHRSRRGSGHAVYGGRLGTTGGAGTPSRISGAFTKRPSTVSAELKAARALQTREALERQASSVALDRIKAKEAAKARAAFRRDPSVQACQAQLITAAVAVRFAEALRAASRTKCVAAPTHQKQTLAAQLIQRMHKRKKNLELWHTSVLFIKCLERSKPRLCLAVRCWRRGRSADRMRTFLTENLSKATKFKVLMYKFIWRVRQCQRAVRDFLACRNGRLAALRKVWDEQRTKFLNKKYSTGAKKSVDFGSTASSGGATPGKRSSMTRQRSMARSNSVKIPDKAEAAAAAALSREKRGAARAEIDGKREEFLRLLLKQQRDAYLVRRLLGAIDGAKSVHDAMQDKGTNRRRHSVSKVFSAEDIQEIMFAAESVKKVDQLFDTLDSGGFLLFRSFHDGKCATVRTVVHSLVARASENPRTVG